MVPDELEEGSSSESAYLTADFASEGDANCSRSTVLSASRNSNSSPSTTTNAKQSIAVAILIWYLSSFAVIFLNKYILSYQHVDPYYLTTVQMFCMAAAAFVRLKFMQWAADGTHAEREYRTPTSIFSNKMIVILGAMRVLTVLFGLVSLNYVAVSFTETVKSSAPIFTAFLAACLLGETTSVSVIISLVPIMAGLAICSASELSFNMVGFLAAMLTNVAECLQFVISKTFLSSSSSTTGTTAAESPDDETELHHQSRRSFSSLKRLAAYFQLQTSTLSPLQLEFASAMAACVVQIPLFVIFTMYGQQQESNSPIDPYENKLVLSAADAAELIARKVRGESSISNTTKLHHYNYFDADVLFTSITSGLCWHVQSLVSWQLMSYVSPVTHSVVNVVKRVLTIWLSVLIFGNVVTRGAWWGAAILIGGVICYNNARRKQQQQIEK